MEQFGHDYMHKHNAHIAYYGQKVPIMLSSQLLRTVDCVVVVGAEQQQQHMMIHAKDRFASNVLYVAFRP